MTKHLSLLSILHYVFGAFVCMGGMFTLFIFGAGAMLAGEAASQQMDEEVPDWLPVLLQSFGLAIFILFLGVGILILLSGFWIARRRNRIGSIVVAFLCLLSFPLGTALGVFTLVVLFDKEVEADYAGGPPPLVP